MDENGRLTLGSLFSGSGSFELGRLLAGIRPVWNSEVEPFPIRVTTKRMPFVKHYGDVNSIRGDGVEPVDIITFGSPCQDLSIAGKRVGLEGEQSSLFFQAVRIIKEMRCATDGRYPRFIVWENVPGAFSSNKGEDFRAVLDAVCSIKDRDISVPRPPKGKWTDAGCIMADGSSIAWRVVDAQLWGVPQRRKRIYLVGDLAGGCAGKVLFESEGVSGYSAEGFRAWQRFARDAAESVGAASGICLNDQGGQRMDVTDDVTCTLRAEAHHPPCIVEAAVLEDHPADSRVGLSGDGRVQTLTSRMGTGGGNVPLIMDAGTPKTLKIRSGCEGGGKGALIQDDKSATLSCNNDQTVFVPLRKGTRPHSVEGAPTRRDRESAGTLVATDHKDPQAEPEYIVRRLTPTECARLQGFPDWWCSDLGTEDPTEEGLAFWREVFETRRRVVGKPTRPKTDKQIIKWLKDPHSDSAEYKMWGNGCSLPITFFVLSGIVWAENKDPSEKMSQ